MTFAFGWALTLIPVAVTPEHPAHEGVYAVAVTVMTLPELETVLLILSYVKALP